jgi:glucose/arabinose dehydrogenase
MYFILRLSLLCLFVNTGLFCRNFILDKIADDLNKPVFLTYSNQIDSTLFLADQNGLIHKIIHGNISDIPLLDITDRVHNPIMPSDERGLLGLAFHPKLGSTYFYVNYIDKEGNTIVSQFEFDSISLIAKQDSEIELLRFKQPYQNHNGGHLLFGPDNKLYIAVGDGGYAGDPHNHGQNIKTFFGSILRIEIDKDEGYRIPKDNPFYEV